MRILDPRIPNFGLVDFCAQRGQIEGHEIWGHSSKNCAVVPSERTTRSKRSLK